MTLGTILILHVMVSGLGRLRDSAQNLLVFKKKKKKVFRSRWVRITFRAKLILHVVVSDLRDETNITLCGFRPE